MTRDEARRLLSGYATGSLTELEKQLLFDAALDDQELFDELAEEQTVKELIELPGAKRRLLLALGPEKKAVLWWPWAAGVAGAAAIAVAVWTSQTEAPVELAKNELPAIAAPATPEPVVEPKQTTEAEEPAPPLERQAAEAASPPPPTLLEKAEALAGNAKALRRDEARPVPTELESRARNELPILAIGQPSRAAAPAAQGFLPQGQQGAQVAAVASATLAMEAAQTRDALTFEVKDTGFLRIVPARSGVLEVATEARTLFPSRVVTAGVPQEISIPLEAQRLRIDFAESATAPPVAATQSQEISGTLVLPLGSNPRVVLTIPAQR